MLNTSELLKQKCHPTEQGLHEKAIPEFLAAVPGWNLTDGKIQRVYSFKNYYETIGFVNAVAFIANREDHHPDLEVGYNHCTVKFNTHSVNGGKGGLSENDFICAAKINALTN
ncbi:4a-hydroxytetrahydrobiopterin dehydratase [Bdellovibrio bacteriovorus]